MMGAPDDVDCCSDCGDVVFENLIEYLIAVKIVA